MRRSASYLLVLTLVVAGRGAAAYDGTVSVTPATADASIAVRLNVGPSQMISGISWLNNDATSSFEKLIVIEATPGAPPDLASGASILANISGPTLDTGTAQLAQPVSTSTGEIFAIFEVPEGSERTAEGNGGGPGIGYVLSQGAQGGYVTSDGIAWTKLHASVELIVSVELALGKGMGVPLASLEPVPRTQPAVEEATNEVAAGPDLQVHPNPFNPTTMIAFTLSAQGHVRAEVFDVRGRLVRVLQDGEVPAGRVELKWSGDDRGGSRVGSGVYLVRIVSAEGKWTKRIALAK